MFLGNRPWANKPFYGHIKLFLLQSIFNATDLKYATVLLGSNALIKWQLSILTKRLFARIWQASMMSHDNSTCSELFSSLVSPASFPVTGSVCAYMRLCLVRKFWAVTAAPSSYLGGSMAELDVGSRRNWFCLWDQGMWWIKQFTWLSRFCFLILLLLSKPLLVLLCVM